MAKQLKPDAITLDIDLPALDGWTVLDRLKHDPATRHIPVHIISVTDEVLRGLKLGAIAHLVQAGHGRGPERRADDDRRLHRAEGEEPAGRRRQRRRAQQHRRADRQRRRQDDGRRDRRGGAGGARADAVRLHGARPRAQRHERIRAAGEDARQRDDVADSRDRLHRQGADQEAGDRAAAGRRDDHHQGRQVARPAARRNGAVPASGRGQPARAEAEDPRAPAQHRSRRWPGRRCSSSTTTSGTSSR